MNDSNIDQTDRRLPSELLELGQKIATLPEEHFAELEESFAKVADCFRRRQRILKLVQETLSQLRLDVKYLLFDLEATRDERDELKAQLQEILPDDFESL